MKTEILTYLSICILAVGCTSQFLSYPTDEKIKKREAKIQEFINANRSRPLFETGIRKHGKLEQVIEENGWISYYLKVYKSNRVSISHCIMILYNESNGIVDSKIETFTLSG